MIKKIKKIKDIFNLFGKKIQFLTFPADQSTEWIHYERLFNVDWEGECIEVTWATSQWRTEIPTYTTRQKKVLTDSSVRGQIRVGEVNYPTWKMWTENNILYFKCINVTKLVVNGETLI